MVSLLVLVVEEQVLLLLHGYSARDGEAVLLLLLLAILEVGMQTDVLAPPHLDVVHRVALSVVLQAHMRMFGSDALVLQRVAELAVVD